ncbi:hypothetical protein [Janthinobacterium sp. ROICE36]|uniref:hypothetical protein n=1 Tax=Janthinobacterium sp. ROICE36 TaxID=2048670 RepID=UPI002155A065|nr:hypothetical protein [Janthinobacterium sp. ROICE36]
MQARNHHIDALRGAAILCVLLLLLHCAQAYGLKNSPLSAWLLALSLIVLLGVLNVPFFANSDGGKDLSASYFVIAIASVLTFWHNVLMQSAGYFNYCLNVYWSLSVEEMFYQLLPLSCRFLRQRLWIMLLCGAAIVAGHVYRSVSEPANAALRRRFRGAAPARAGASPGAAP